MAKLKKNKTKSRKSPDVFTEIRGLGVLIENVDDKVSAVAEQYGDIKENISTVKQTLNSHTKMIGKLMIDMSIVKTDIEFIKNSLKRKVDTEEFAALERRVALLERRR